MNEKNNHPHSLRSELRVLSHMLYADAASIVAEGVSKEWFFSAENQVVFESIRQVFDAGQDVDEFSTLPVLQANMRESRMDVDSSFIADGSSKRLFLLVDCCGKEHSQQTPPA